MNEQIIAILQKIADEIADVPTYYDKYDIIDEIITPKIKEYSIDN